MYITLLGVFENAAKCCRAVPQTISACSAPETFGPWEFRKNIYPTNGM